jgi:hypothetical protein
LVLLLFAVLILILVQSSSWIVKKYDSAKQERELSSYKEGKGVFETQNPNEIAIVDSAKSGMAEQGLNQANTPENQSAKMGAAGTSNLQPQ